MLKNQKENNLALEYRNIFIIYDQLYSLFGDSFLQQIYWISNFSSIHLSLFDIQKEQQIAKKATHNVFKFKTFNGNSYLENRKKMPKNDYAEFFENPLKPIKKMSKINITIKTTVSNIILFNETFDEQMETELINSAKIQLSSWDKSMIYIRKLRKSNKNFLNDNVSAFSFYNIIL